MTDEDARNIIGNIANELSQLRKRRTCLLAKADLFLQEVNAAQRLLSEQLGRESSTQMSHSPSIQGWPSSNDIVGLIGELRDASTRMEVLEGRAKELRILA